MSRGQVDRPPPTASPNKAMQRHETSQFSLNTRESIKDDSSPSKASDATSVKTYGSWITTVPNPTAETSFLIMHSMNACNALFVISDILSLTCSAHPRTYNPPKTNASATPPPALHPTSLQKTISHHAYIDMLPFPLLRDRILETLQVINEEELCRDLQNDEWKIWGRRPWEPRSWEFSEEFVAKWWFLLDEEMLRGTNFWRGQRMEEPLRLPHRQKLLEGSDDSGRISTVL
jgi:hypothetical protein